MTSASSAQPSTHDRGRAYEHAVLARILQEPTTACAYLWSHCPERVLRQAGLFLDYRLWGRQLQQEAQQESQQQPNDHDVDGPGVGSGDSGDSGESCDSAVTGIPDTGIDIVVIRTDGTPEAVQCKGFASHVTLGQGQLQGLYRLLHHMRDHNPAACARVVYSGRLTNVLRTDALVSKRIRYEHLPYSDAVPVPVPKYDSEDQGEGEAALQLYPVQREALDAAVAWWRRVSYGDGDEDGGGKRAFISMPCGCGKMLVAGRFLACTFDDMAGAVFAIPLREHAAQASMRLRAMLSEWRVLLVDTDGCRDVDRLVEVVREKEAEGRQVLLVTTFKSADVVAQVVAADREHDGLPVWGSRLGSRWALIVDEFHNLTADDLQLPRPEKPAKSGSGGSSGSQGFAGVCPGAGAGASTSEMARLIAAAPGVLGTSATPRIYSLERSVDDRATHMGRAL